MAVDYDALYVVSACRLGFLQHSGWVPRGSIPRASILDRSGGSCKAFCDLAFQITKSLFHIILAVKTVTELTQIQRNGEMVSCTRWRSGRLYSRKVCGILLQPPFENAISPSSIMKHLFPLVFNVEFLIALQQL